MSKLVYWVRLGRECRWARGHMSDYLDGELRSSRRVRMERHATRCPKCRALLATLRRTVGALHRLPSPGGGAGARDIAASVRQRLGELPPP